MLHGAARHTLVHVVSHQPGVQSARHRRAFGHKVQFGRRDPATCNMSCNVTRNMQRTACNEQHARCNEQYTAEDMQVPASVTTDNVQPCNTHRRSANPCVYRWPLHGARWHGRMGFVYVACTVARLRRSSRWSAQADHSVRPPLSHRRLSHRRLSDGVWQEPTCSHSPPRHIAVPTHGAAQSHPHAPAHRLLAVTAVLVGVRCS